MSIGLSCPFVSPFSPHPYKSESLWIGGDNGIVSLPQFLFFLETITVEETCGFFLAPNKLLWGGILSLDRAVPHFPFVLSHVASAQHVSHPLSWSHCWDSRIEWFLLLRTRVRNFSTMDRDILLPCILHIHGTSFNCYMARLILCQRLFGLILVRNRFSVTLFMSVQCHLRACVWVTEAWFGKNNLDFQQAPLSQLTYLKKKAKHCLFLHQLHRKKQEICVQHEPQGVSTAHSFSCMNKKHKNDKPKMSLLCLMRYQSSRWNRFAVYWLN